jgi:hypothetical protein
MTNYSTDIFFLRDNGNTWKDKQKLLNVRRSWINPDPLISEKVLDSILKAAINIENKFNNKRCHSDNQSPERDSIVNFRNITLANGQSHNWT